LDSAGDTPAATATTTLAYSPKIFLAIHYNFVMIRGAYEENILFLRSWAFVRAANRVRMFGLFRR
jgi:hypothetical protein